MRFGQICDMGIDGKNDRKCPPLSKRLKMDADFVEEGALLADVGCDHAYCSIYLALSGKIKHSIAMDVREGPLCRAGANIHFYGVQDSVETRISDGLSALNPKEADCILIGGMGGALMQEILERGFAHVRACKSIVLQPQSEIASVRRYLHKKGMWIAAEDMCHEDGKYYTVIKAKWELAGENIPNGSSLPLAAKRKLADEKYSMTLEERYGPCLIRDCHPVLREFLQEELTKTEQLIAALKEQDTERARKRLDALCKEKDAQCSLLEKISQEKDGVWELGKMR